MREYAKNTVKQALLGYREGHNTHPIKRVFSAFLGITILTTTFIAALIPLTEIPIYAAGTGKILQLGTGPLENGSTVYYGSKNNAIEWKIIGFDGNGVASGSGNATLISSEALGTTTFSASQGKYENSYLHREINTILSGRFTDKEKADTVMPDRTLLGKTDQAEAYAYGNSNYIWGNDLTGQKLWPLSTKEARALKIYLSGIAGIGSIWALRSLGHFDYNAACVHNDGSVNYMGNSVTAVYRVRPAFNINLSSIILTSVAEGGKISNGTGANALNAVDNTTAVTDWKLTVLDDAREDFEAWRTDYNDFARGKTLSVEYSGAQTGDSEYVSAIITNSAGTVLYYGRIAQCSSANGEASITIPDDNNITDTCKLYVFQEQCNVEKKTDYSSVKTDITTKAAKKDLKATDFTYKAPKNTVYDGNAKEATVQVVETCDYNGQFTVKYYDSEDNELAGPPKAVGEYKVRVNAAGNEKYNAKDGITADSWKFEITDNVVAVTGVSVSPTEVTLKPDATKKLTATVEPEDATNKDVTWKSDDESIAKVSDDGTVTAVAEGETSITVKTDDGNKTATCKVIVKKDAPVVETCTISFDANGGEGEMDDQMVYIGEKTCLNKNEFTRDGYSFDSWNTDSDGDGTGYDDKDYITPKKDEKEITLYAQWKKGKHNHDDDDEDDDHHEDEGNKPAAVNPLALTMGNMTGLPYGSYLARCEQGPAAKALFASSRPAGYVEGFTFNLITNGTANNTLKKGSFTMTISAELRKAGRTFAIVALDKNGKTFVLPDTDTDPNTITVAFDLEGYAFDLIYKD